VHADGTAALTGEKLLSIDLTEENRLSLLQQVASFAQERAGEFQSKRREKLARKRAKPDRSKGGGGGGAEEEEEEDDDGEEAAEEEEEEVGTKRNRPAAASPGGGTASKSSSSSSSGNGSGRDSHEAAEWRKFCVWLSQFQDDEDEKADSNGHAGKSADGTLPPPSSSSSSSSATAQRSSRCPYDVIVDGANVGYYKQNFAGAPRHIDFRQVAPYLSPI
jgi:hypothetical protein